MRGCPGKPGSPRIVQWSRGPSGLATSAGGTRDFVLEFSSFPPPHIPCGTDALSLTPPPARAHLFESPQYNFTRESEEVAHGHRGHGRDPHEAGGSDGTLISLFFALPSYTLRHRCAQPHATAGWYAPFEFPQDDLTRESEEMAHEQQARDSVHAFEPRGFWQEVRCKAKRRRSARCGRNIGAFIFIATSNLNSENLPDIEASREVPHIQGFYDLPCPRFGGWLPGHTSRAVARLSYVWLLARG